MANTVLDNFRKKYPDYDDMSDIDLATKLANKYPEYQDVLDSVKNTSEKKSNKNDEKKTLEDVQDRARRKHVSSYGGSDDRLI
jgi:hypothetical protein